MRGQGIENPYSVAPKVLRPLHVLPEPVVVVVGQVAGVAVRDLAAGVHKRAADRWALTFLLKAIVCRAKKYTKLPLAGDYS